MKKAHIKNRLYDVATLQEYATNSDLYNPKFTAIETGDLVLPLRSSKDDPSQVGVFYKPGNSAARLVNPSLEDAHNYSNKHIIDYSNPKNIDEVIKKENLVRDIENEILTTKENIFRLNIGPDDSPEMVAMKQAINKKEVDIKQYEPRFAQFQNDIRLLRGKSITLGKMVSTCNNFDITAELVLRDRPNCANPMHTEIHIDLTGGQNNNETK